MSCWRNAAGPNVDYLVQVGNCELLVIEATKMIHGWFPLYIMYMVHNVYENVKILSPLLGN